MEDSEKLNFTDQSAEVEEFSIVEGDDAQKDPRQFTHFISGGKCGSRGYNFIRLQNTHKTKSIGVTILTKWIYNRRPRSSTKSYRLTPGQIVGIGCPVPGPTSQRFDFSISGAWFL